MTEPGNDKLKDEIARLPEPLRAPLHRWTERLADQGDDSSATLEVSQPHAETLVRLLASSEYAAGVLLRDWAWFVSELASGVLDQAPVDSVLSDLMADSAAADDDLPAFKTRLRRTRNRQLLRILWRTMSGRDDVWESLRTLSRLADALIISSMQFSEQVLAGRFGKPVNAEGEAIPLIILAMGKLGGSELNFSSDVDLMFLYPDAGETDGARSLSAHEYFTRLAQHVVNLLDDVTADGFVYRVDTRLRPFGDSGPPVVSFTALENYLVQHGRSWERYAYIKARVLVPSASAATIDDLHASMIDPFVYRRYLDYGVFESLRDMKALIEAEVLKRELANNIKLGPGGIREIEFIAQSLQLVRGGADRHLRCRELREALLRLGRSRSLARDTVAALLAAYEFLRRCENAIQAIRDQQTHDIPASAVDRARLLLVMSYDDWDTFNADLMRHCEQVMRHFSEVAFRTDNGAAPAAVADALATHWRASSPQDEWLQFLQDEAFNEAEQLSAAISSFANAPVHRQVDGTARKRLELFMRSLLAMLKERRHPAKVCERVLGVITNIVRRSAYVALLNENPAALERLVGLCDQSAYLAAEIARFPLLLDELLDPRLYTAAISASSMRDDLDERLARLGDEDSESQIETLAQFQRATLFRIAVADVSGNLPIMKVSDRLTELAEIVLREALDIAWTDLTGKHGEPRYTTDAGTRHAGFGVIAYGKLGGMELSYGSDLDLVFLHDSRGSGQLTDGDKALDNSMFFGRLVRRLVHFLTTQTSSGALYEVDTRLRPSGRSGLLVVTTDGFETYQEDNAWTWEHQALLRSRPVAGSAAVAREFERIRAETLRHRVRREQLLDDVLAMRQKMRQQLDKGTAGMFDLKQGEGGIGDIEFLVQYLVLKNAGNEPALIHFSDNIRQLGTLGAVQCLAAEDVARLQEVYKSYRLSSHRLVLDGNEAMVPDSEFVDERQFVRAVWQREMR